MSKLAKVLNPTDIRELTTLLTQDKPRHSAELIRCIEQRVLSALAEQEPEAWFTEDDLTEKLVTTYDPYVRDLWEDIGKHVTPLYAHPCVPENAESETHPMQNLTKELQDDAEYAWSWHCNIAMPIMDSTGLSHREANIAAARLMQHLFGIDTEKHPNFEVDPVPEDIEVIVPDGWQLVPKEPSRDMLKKMFYEMFDMNGIEEEQLAARYRHMLSAFPKYAGEDND